MPSPFPGMDPYLEGQEWSDCYQRFATVISDHLMAQVRPHYVVRLAITIASDLPLEQERMARLVTVEIRETNTHRLVTSIELLSPVNKRKPGLTKFLEKRARLQEAGVHLVDIDLIRRGKRPVTPPSFTEMHPLAKAHYSVMLTRAKANQIELWPIRVQEQLPTIAIPLRPTDQDIPLDLQAVFTAIYDKAGYDLSLDYSQPPPLPAFDDVTQNWVSELLKDYR
jgi:hypothetical protein